MNVYTHMYIYTHAFLRLYICMYTCIHEYLRIYLSIHILIHVCIHIEESFSHIRVLGLTLTHCLYISLSLSFTFVLCFTLSFSLPPPHTRTSQNDINTGYTQLECALCARSMVRETHDRWRKKPTPHVRRGFELQHAATRKQHLTCISFSLPPPLSLALSLSCLSLFLPRLPPPLPNTHTHVHTHKHQQAHTHPYLHTRHMTRVRGRIGADVVQGRRQTTTHAR